MSDKKVKMVKCPGRDLMLPEDDTDAQVKHMDEKHPDIVTERKRKPLY